MQECQQTKYMIENDAQADKAIQKISEQKQAIKAWSQYYAEKFQQIKDECESKIAYYEAILFDYFQCVKRRESKTQLSYPLPSGKLVYKKPKTVYTHDDTLLLPWAKQQNGDFIKTTETPKWDNIKKHMLETGEIPDGVTVEEKPGEFRVE